MPTVILGNAAPVEARKLDDNSTAVEKVPVKGLKDSRTTFNFPKGTPPGEMLATVTGVFESHHSNRPASWVESDSAALAELLADHYGCAVGRPKEKS